jgi:putative FmdB family regulatory protein
MPIFEYICRKCDLQFEVIANANSKTQCPSCKGERLEKQLSVFAAGSKRGQFENTQVPACGSCGDPRGPGSCSLN